MIVAALAHAGHSGEARRQLMALLESQPKTTIARVLKVLVLMRTKECEDTSSKACVGLKCLSD